MTNEKEKKGKSTARWLLPLVTALVGILATIVVAMYQSYRSEQQAIQAEAERARNVKSGLVSIVEEHVINEKAFDGSRLARLIDLRTREERLTTSITVMEVLEKAEYNILNSQYLDFTQKEKYKSIFDNCYAAYYSHQFEEYKGKEHVNLINDLVQSIQSNQPASEALKKLKRLIDAYGTDVNQLQSQISSKREVKTFFETFRILLEKPTLIISASFVYMIFILLWYIRRKRLMR